MKIIIALFGLLLILAFGITLFQKGEGIYLPFGAPRTSVKIQDTMLKIQVAKTPKEKELGLSGKKSLPKDQGMLFIFDRSEYYSFWMKNMKFPIDIIYLEKSKIITIHHNVPNPKAQDENLPIYKPTAPADMVLEINGGIAKEKNFKEGDIVAFTDLDSSK